MVLCDKCNKCFHPECTVEEGGTDNHRGPFFCSTCKGYTLSKGFQDIIEDWPLHAYLSAGSLPEDEEEQDRILRHAENYQANRNKLQVFFPKSEKLIHTGEKIEVLPDRWINLAPIANHK